MSGLLDDVAVHEHFAALPTVTFAPGETVLAAGTTTGRLFVLRSGRVEVIRDGLTLATSDQPGAVFGELALLLDQPHGADVRALAPSTFHVADGAKLLRADPVVALHVATILARRLHGANEALVEVRDRLSEGTPRRTIGEALERLRGAMSHGDGSRPDRYHDLLWE